MSPQRRRGRPQRLHLHYFIPEFFSHCNLQSNRFTKVWGLRCILILARGRLCRFALFIQNILHCIDTILMFFLLFYIGCVKALGLSDDIIGNHQMSSSSSVAGSAPYMARLFNTPTSASQTYAHWSPNDNNPYIQVRHLNNVIWGIENP